MQPLGWTETMDSVQMSQTKLQAVVNKLEKQYWKLSNELSDDLLNDINLKDLAGPCRSSYLLLQRNAKTDSSDNWQVKLRLEENDARAEKAATAYSKLWAFETPEDLKAMFSAQFDYNDRSDRVRLYTARPSAHFLLTSLFPPTKYKSGKDELAAPSRTILEISHAFDKLCRVEKEICRGSLLMGSSANEIAALFTWVQKAATDTRCNLSELNWGTPTTRIPSSPDTGKADQIEVKEDPEMNQLMYTMFSQYDMALEARGDFDLYDSAEDAADSSAQDATGHNEARPGPESTEEGADRGMQVAADVRDERLDARRIFSHSSIWTSDTAFHGAFLVHKVTQMVRKETNLSESDIFSGAHGAKLSDIAHEHFFKAGWDSATKLLTFGNVKKFAEYRDA